MLNGKLGLLYGGFILPYFMREDEHKLVFLCLKCTAERKVYMANSVYSFRTLLSSVNRTLVNKLSLITKSSAIKSTKDMSFYDNWGIRSQGYCATSLQRHYSYGKAQC